MRLFQLIRLASITLFLLSGYSVLTAQDEGCHSLSDKLQKKENEAFNLARRGDFEEARAILLAILEKDANYARGYFLIGEMDLNAGDYQGGLTYFQKSRDLCESVDPLIDWKLGEMYYEHQNYIQAHYYLSSFVSNTTSTDQAKLVLADSLVKRTEVLASLFSHPVPFDPEPLPTVSTKFGEYLPIVTRDHEYLYYTKRFKRQNKFSITGGSKWVEEFTVSHIDGENYGEGKALPPPFNMGMNEGGASMSIDNKELFLTVCNTDDGYGSCDIYTSKYVGGQWQSLQNLGGHINDSTWQSQVSLNAKGDVLYFASDRPGGFGGMDLYKIIRNRRGKWSAPINLGSKINTKYDEKSPFIHTDDETLYFSSRGHDAIGGFDIYLTRKKEGEFGNPMNLGHPINTHFDDLGFFVSTEGKTGYFASNNLEEGVGGWDIYSFPLYEGARPQKTLFVKGQLKDENGQAITNASIELKDLETNEVTQIDVDSTTGDYVYSSVFKSDVLLTVNKKGHFYGSKLLTVEDEELEVPSTIDFTMKKVEAGDEFNIENILFETNSYDLKASSKIELESLVRFMEVNENVDIQISGHTDNIGDEESNRILSQNRAKAVNDFLKSLGINENRMRFKGYGESKPIATNETEEGRAKNRRTVVEIVKI